MKRPSRWRAAAINIGVIAALLWAASLLPPDTSFSDRQDVGVVKLCVPPSFPPLVTNDPTAPGYDVELAGLIARELDLSLQVNRLPSIGRDYNPRNWFLTRAQCDLVGGGVADFAQTRSFMQVLPTNARTGWVGISRSGTLPAEGTVAVLPGTSGLDRLALSSALRQLGLRGQLVRSQAELAQVLQIGSANAAVTERFVADSLDLDPTQFSTFWLDQEGLASASLALGLWKGDLTFKRAVEAAMADLEASGELETLRNRYGVDTDPS